LRAQENANAVTDLQHREDIEKSDYHVPAPKLEDLRGNLYDFWEGKRNIVLPCIQGRGLPTSPSTHFP
jgi:hypothetical protein